MESSSNAREVMVTVWASTLRREKLAGLERERSSRIRLLSRPVPRTEMTRAEEEGVVAAEVRRGRRLVAKRRRQ